MSSLDLEIRGRLADYLSGKASLRQFHEYFMPEAWNIDQRADSATASLVHEIDLLLAEFSNGDWTEQELMEKLRPFVTNYSFTIGSVSMTVASQTELKHFQLGHQSSRVDIRPVKVSA